MGEGPAACDHREHPHAVRLGQGRKKGRMVQEGRMGRRGESENGENGKLSRRKARRKHERVCKATAEPASVLLGSGGES